MVLEPDHDIADKESCKARATKDVSDRMVGNFDFCKKVQKFGTFLQIEKMDVIFKFCSRY